MLNKRMKNILCWMLMSAGLFLQTKIVDAGTNAQLTSDSSSASVAGNISATTASQTQIYGNFDVAFTVIVYSDSEGVPGTTCSGNYNNGQEYGVYYAVCPPGSVSYYPPGYGGPYSVGDQGSQSNLALCAMANQNCGSNNSAMWNDTSVYNPGVRTQAWCKAPFQGWLPVSTLNAALQAAEQATASSGVFATPSIILDNSFSYYYTVYTTSGGRSVHSQNPVPGFNLSAGSDLNSEYTKQYACWNS